MRKIIIATALLAFSATAALAQAREGRGRATKKISWTEYDLKKLNSLLEAGASAARASAALTAASGPFSRGSANLENHF